MPIRRQLKETTKKNARIKVFVEEKVIEVNFIKETEKYVYYILYTQTAKSQAPKQERIDKRLAFNAEMPNEAVVNAVKASSVAVKTAKSEKLEHGLLKFVRDSFPDRESLSDDIFTAAIVEVLSDLTLEELGPELGAWRDPIEEKLDELKPDLTHRQQAAGGTVKKSKPDWKTKPTEAGQKRIRETLPTTHPGHGLLSRDSQLDHKISRKALKRMMRELAVAPKDQAGVAEMRGFIETVKKITGESTNEQKAIENWPANLELGFYSTDRQNPTLDKFDGSYTTSGTATPRTEPLEKADEIINSGNIDWNELVKKLKKAQEEQQKLELTGSGIGRGQGQLTFPRVGIYEQTASGQFQRNEKAKVSNTQ